MSALTIVVVISMLETRYETTLTAKTALTEVLSDPTRLGLMAPKYAEEVAHMILHDNARRLYGLSR